MMRYKSDCTHFIVIYLHAKMTAVWWLSIIQSIYMYMHIYYTFSVLLALLTSSEPVVVVGRDTLLLGFGLEGPLGFPGFLAFTATGFFAFRGLVLLVLSLRLCKTITSQ